MQDGEFEKILEKKKEEHERELKKILEKANGHQDIFVIREENEIKIINPKPEDSLFPTIVKKAIKV